MSKMKLEFLIIVSTVLILSSHESAANKSVEYQNFRKEWKFQGFASVKYPSRIASEDNSFLYATCLDDRLPSEVICNVTIDAPFSKWDSTKGSSTRSCLLELFGSEDGGGGGSNSNKSRHEITTLSSLERFGQDRVVVTWWERQKSSQYEIQNIRVTLINLNTCKTNHLTFPIDVDGHILLSNVVLYDNGFDVVVSSRSYCGHSTCRLSHDAEGRRVKTVPFVGSFADALVEPVMARSPSKGFFVSGSDVDSWKFRSIHLAKDGTIRNLMTVKVSDPRQMYRVTSNAHELYAVCMMGEKSIHCAQFDAKGSATMNATIVNTSNVQWMAVHNLEEDGALLLTGRCNNQKCRTFKVTRLHRSGRRTKLMDVPELHLRCSKVPDGLSVNVAETDADFCVYIACSSSQIAVGKRKSRTTMQFTSKCISKSILKLYL